MKPINTRQAFEEWAESEKMDTRKHYGNGSYVHQSTRHAYIGWQAALAWRGKQEQQGFDGISEGQYVALPDAFISKDQPQGWITDRRPTVKDADIRECLVVPSLVWEDGYMATHWMDVDHDEPWQTVEYAEKHWTPDNPAPRP